MHDTVCSAEPVTAGVRLSWFLLFCREKPFGKPHKELNKRKVGGPLEPQPKGPLLKLRMLLDGSSLEVFTHTGAALSTRVYR